MYAQSGVMASYRATGIQKCKRRYIPVNLLGTHFKKLEEQPLLIPAIKRIAQFV